MLHFVHKFLQALTCLSTFLVTDVAVAPDDRPLVIGHRGASGYRPEHTLEAYRLAIELGADFIEPDLVATRDGVLIARHENELGSTTDVADRPEFAGRMTTKLIDGVSTTGWFSEDFTLAEIKTLRARERIPAVRPDNTAFDGLFEIPTLGEVIQLVREFEDRTGRKIGIYPETKHPTFFAIEGRRLDGSPINTSLGQLLIDTLVAEDFVDPTRIFIQSFEVANLIELQNVIMPAASVDIPLVQLYGDVTDAFVQPSSGFSRPYDMVYNAANGGDLNAIYGGLAALVPGGITSTTGYSALTGTDVLTWISQNYAEGMGPWKNSVLLRDAIDPPIDCNNDGTPEVEGQLTGQVAPFLSVALGLGLEVHPYTLRTEENFLTLNDDGTCRSIQDEAAQLLALGVTGYFIDQPDDGFSGREQYERSRSTRFATFNAALVRNSQGQLITDLSTSDDSQARAVAEIIQRVNPDILLINEFDFDDQDTAIGQFQKNYLSIGWNGAEPVEYPFVFNGPSNTGIPSGLDLDNNGDSTGPGDALGFGFHPGQYGMVLLSKYPIESVRTFRNFLWKDMPGALLPDNPLTPASVTADWYDQEELAVLPLSSKSHWDASINVEGVVVHVLCAHPTPPVFDGPEDRNGRRNFDEIRLWSDYVTPGAGSYIFDDKGTSGGLPMGVPFVVLGDYNADPNDGDAFPGAIRQLTQNPLINKDCTPESDGGFESVDRQGGANLTHIGSARQDTGDLGDKAPGNLRLDYVLTSLDFRILRSGVFWPTSTDPLFRLVGKGDPIVSSDHRLVWIDAELLVSPPIDPLANDSSVTNTPATKR